MKKLVLSVFTVSAVALLSTGCATKISYDNSELYKLPNTVQDSEGNTYRTVKIGEQNWFAESLRSTKFQDGSKVATGFIVDDNEENLLTLGRLYNWFDTSDERNICPAGWHVATDDDWKELERAIGMSEEEIAKEGWRGQKDQGITLKESQPDTLFKSFDQTQVNKNKFFVRASGLKWRDWYGGQGGYGEFWTATSVDEENGYNRTFSYSNWSTNQGQLHRNPTDKTWMFAVRCVENK